MRQNQPLRMSRLCFIAIGVIGALTAVHFGAQIVLYTWDSIMGTAKVCVSEEDGAFVAYSKLDCTPRNLWSYLTAYPDGIPEALASYIASLAVITGLVLTLRIAAHLAFVRDARQRSLAACKTKN